MPNRLTMLVMLFMCTLNGWAWSQVPRDGSQKNNPTQPKTGKATAPTQPCLCNLQVQNAPSKETQGSQQKPSKYPWRELYAPANIPSWLLTIVAGFAGIMALKTLWAIEKQVKLQSAGMEQWIEVSNWRSQLFSVPLTNSPFPCLVVKVDIVNKTSFPVTLKRAEIDFINTGDNARRTYFAGENTFLTPSAPHEVTIAAQVTEQQVSQFPLGGIGIQIAGRFLHIGRLKKLVAQEMSGLLVCSQSETVFVPGTHMNPKSKD